MLIQFVLYCCWYQPSLASVCKLLKLPPSLVSLETFEKGLLRLRTVTKRSSRSRRGTGSWGCQCSSLFLCPVRCLFSQSRIYLHRHKSLNSASVCTCLPAPYPHSSCLPPPCLFFFLRNIESPAAFMPCPSSLTLVPLFCATGGHLVAGFNKWPLASPIEAADNAL